MKLFSMQCVLSELLPAEAVIGNHWKPGAFSFKLVKP
jgi:hypothetical protein